MADEPSFEPPRLLRWSLPMPGQESQGRDVQVPNSPVLPHGRGIRRVRQSSGARWDHGAQANVPNASGLKRAYQRATGFDRRSSDPVRAQRNYFAAGSGAANLRPSAEPNRAHRGPRDSGTVQMEPVGTPRTNPGAPIILVHGHKHNLSLVPLGPDGC